MKVKLRGRCTGCDMMTPFVCKKPGFMDRVTVQVRCGGCASLMTLQVMRGKEKGTAAIRCVILQHSTVLQEMLKQEAEERLKPMEDLTQSPTPHEAKEASPPCDSTERTTPIPF